MMTPREWLRAVMVWSPFAKANYQRYWDEADVFETMAETLHLFWPPEAFSEATVKAVARQCETFPNYYWINRALEGAGFRSSNRRSRP